MSEKIIAVVGASGKQGGGVVRALQERGRFRVRALTRSPAKHPDLGDEVVEADLDRPETLEPAFSGAHGVFMVTNFWAPGTDEGAQAKSAIDAAKRAGIKHFVWSTLPNIEAISGGRFEVPHFTHKAEIDALVAQAGFDSWTFVEAPFYFQNLADGMAPQPQEDGSKAWMLPIDPSKRVIHMGDIGELGLVVAGAFEQPERVGRGAYLSLVGGLYSFDDVVETLRQQGHNVAFKRISAEVFGQFFPGADEMAQMLVYFENFTYMGPEADAKIELAKEVAMGPFTPLAEWAKKHMPVDGAA